MTESSWIQAHMHLMNFLDGYARLLVSDNLRTGIISHRKHEGSIANRTYQDFANHYGMALLPARVQAPRDKAAVESCVSQVTTHIIAKLRNHLFFDLYEMNIAIRKNVEEL